MKYSELIVVTNEWIDIIKLYEDKKAIRNTNNDYGDYEIIDNKLDIIWNIWGKETFYNFNGIYYNCNNNEFEIFIETETINSMWNDICIFNIETNKVYKKNYKEFGKFVFKKNKLLKIDLLIEWDNSGTILYNQLGYGKIYSNTKFK